MHADRSRFRSGALLLGALLAGGGYKEVPPPAKVVLPPPQTPAQSLAAIQVPTDLEIELVAAEPVVMDPVDLAWGPDGRMWVVERADYPAGMDGAGQPAGRVRVLESTRGDGSFDRSTVFADGLRSPTSLCSGAGFVLAAQRGIQPYTPQPGR